MHYLCSHQENNFQIETLKINPKDTATIKKIKLSITVQGKQYHLSSAAAPLTITLIQYTLPSQCHTHTNSCVHSFHFSEQFFSPFFTNSSLVGAQEQKMMNERIHVGYVNQTLCIYSGNPLPLSSGTPHWPVWRTTFSQSGITLPHIQSTFSVSRRIRNKRMAVAEQNLILAGVKHEDRDF